ncbi:hypothetical protein KM043_001264 [Ampulex compressa]|nr:hypothetical protein KM043_001264 [Ampulex compressa]
MFHTDRQTDRDINMQAQSFLNANPNTTFINPTRSPYHQRTIRIPKSTRPESASSVKREGVKAPLEPEESPLGPIPSIGGLRRESGGQAYRGCMPVKTAVKIRNPRAMGESGCEVQGLRRPSMSSNARPRPRPLSCLPDIDADADLMEDRAPVLLDLNALETLGLRIGLDSYTISSSGSKVGASSGRRPFYEARNSSWVYPRTFAGSHQKQDGLFEAILAAKEGQPVPAGISRIKAVDELLSAP